MKKAIEENSFCMKAEKCKEASEAADKELEELEGDDKEAAEAV